MTESTLSLFINLAVICGICVGLSKISLESHTYSNSMSDTFIAFFFFDK